ncbi:MAG: cupredoxin domain-containing protein [Pseudomonadota bacterium]|uniref:cupredoxin domain-containing protein n=1 Tax=Cupriavidus sp. TaxID=1873897 RepID=UPI0025B93C7C|nr:cupredoxin domain-containing protein [Cupriavidus sp.]MCA3187995.1 cupredoxin domain-containing protein [Cupriavidus sp.]MCA3191636.1 cupredoxin domain-containing protein [Cupriavidus sp.]
MTVILRRLALVLAAACSGPAALAQELPSFEVVARNGRLIPSRLEVPAGKRIKLVLKNEGPGPLEFENDEMRIEKVISAGVTSFVVLPSLKPGEYSFIDEFNPVTGELKLIAK